MVSCKSPAFSFPIPDDDYPNHLGNHLGEKTYGGFLGHWGAPKSSMLFLEFPICKPSSCYGFETYMVSGEARVFEKPPAADALLLAGKRSTAG